MKLYRVIRYGNHKEGPDGDDTNFLVAAESHIQAGELTDELLRHLPQGELIYHFSNVIVEIDCGNCGHTATEPGIIMGPSYEPGYQRLRKKSWVREDSMSNWEEENFEQ